MTISFMMISRLRYVTGTGHDMARQLRRVAVEHLPALAACTLYFAAVWVFFVLTRQVPQWTVRWWYPTFFAPFVVLSAVMLTMRPSARRLESLGGAFIVAVLSAPFQSTFNSVKQVIDDVRGYPWDSSFARADQWLHFGRQPWEWLLPIVRNSDAIRLIDLGYMLWFPVVFGFLFWLAWSEQRNLRRRALTATILVWAVCGNVAAFLLASAGPCYYTAVTSGHDPYGELIALLDTFHRQQFLFARANQVALWNAMNSGSWLPFGGISAMPSVHVAMTALIALVGRERNPTVGFLLSAYAIFILLGSVALGWHYAVDGYLGALMAYGIWRIVRSSTGDLTE